MRASVPRPLTNKTRNLWQYAVNLELAGHAWRGFKSASDAIGALNKELVFAGGYGVDLLDCIDRNCGRDKDADQDDEWSPEPPVIPARDRPGLFILKTFVQELYSSWEACDPPRAPREMQVDPDLRRDVSLELFNIMYDVAEKTLQRGECLYLVGDERASVLGGEVPDLFADDAADHLQIAVELVAHHGMFLAGQCKWYDSVKPRL